jgi:hypothetical protein
MYGNTTVKSLCIIDTNLKKKKEERTLGIRKRATREKEDKNKIVTSEGKCSRK